MERRKFIAMAAIGAAWPSMARAQQNVTIAKITRIGVLWHASNADQENIYLDVLTKAFSDLGYVEGKNIEFLHRFPAEQPDRFRTFARELVECTKSTRLSR
jgi:putative tryptophan/tyrosine transport system substrate-binding protein